MDICAVVLAAGENSRMRSEHARFVHCVAGKPMICRIRDTLYAAGANDQAYIVGHRQEEVRSALGEEVAFILQENRLGTGHAVMQASQFLEGRAGCTLILRGDMPLVKPGTLKRMLSEFQDKSCAAVIATSRKEDPTGYGRIIRDDDKQIRTIVEQKDASAAQLDIHEVNTGLYCFNTSLLLSALGKIASRNHNNRYYLTDTISILIQEGYSICTMNAGTDETLIVSDRISLQKAAAIVYQDQVMKHMQNGVTIEDPRSTFIEEDVRIGQDTIIHPNCRLSGDTAIGSKTRIGPDTSLTDVTVENNVRLDHVTARKCYIANNVAAGPYVNIRPESHIGTGCRIGNFVEIKNSRIGARCRISHQCYIGDADVGKHVTIGSSCSIANYDGQEKTRTTIGNHVFVGSNCSLISPVVLEDNAYIAAGSVVTEDVPQYALAIARQRQVNKENWVIRRGRSQNNQ